MAISPDTGSSPGQLNFYQQVTLSMYFPFKITRNLCCHLYRSTNASAQLPVQPFLANSSFNPSLLKPSLNQRFSQPVAFETLTRTIFAQTFFQPALFSTSRFRNPYSHKVCSNLPSTHTVLNHSLSKPLLARSLPKHSFSQRFLNQSLSKPLLAQTFPQPTLFSASPSRNPYSHNLCSNLLSTNALLNQSLSKPLLARTLLKPSLNHRFSQPLAFETLPRQILAQSSPQPPLLKATPPQTDSPPRRPAPTTQR